MHLAGRGGSVVFLLYAEDITDKQSDFIYVIAGIGT